MKLSDFNGKTVKSIDRQIRGHYDYVEYVVTFTDDTKIVFSGNAHANCLYELCPKQDNANP